MVAAGFSDLRPEISGILISAEPSVLKMAATDTFRLAETKIPGAQIKNSFKQGFKVIVPLKTVQELVKIVSNDEMVTIYLENNQILFKTQDVEIVSRLIDGNFPDYEAIIPKEIGIEISVNREEFINAIKLIGSFASKVSDVKLKTRDKKIVEVYSNDSSLGENNYLMPAKISGGDVELTFNWRYLLDGVKVGAGDQVLMGINGDAKPALIKTPEDTSYFYILMPVKQ
ncbi:MAG: DNA polymerase III subunit beta [Candidatus Colwellbacteria bacterium]|nr:DNA polymerase III subunit beta [Candidatus Colwellbacteria bacterium]